MTITEPKSGDNVALLWRTVRDVVRQNTQMRAELDSLRSQVAQLGRWKDSPAPRHPFKIYTLPPVHRLTLDYVEGDEEATEEKRDQAWRTFRVRSGMVGMVEATGTDGALYPDRQDNPEDAEDNEIVVDAGAEHYRFWLEIGQTGGVLTATVRHSGDPIDVSPGNPNPWTSFPEPDGRHILIGWVDTYTDQDKKRAHIRQILRTDVILPTVLGVCEEGVDKTYYFGAVEKIPEPEE